MLRIKKSVIDYISSFESDKLAHLFLLGGKKMYVTEAIKMGHGGCSDIGAVSPDEMAGALFNLESKRVVGIGTNRYFDGDEIGADSADYEMCFSDGEDVVSNLKTLQKRFPGLYFVALDEDRTGIRRAWRLGERITKATIKVVP